MSILIAEDDSLHRLHMKELLGAHFSDYGPIIEAIDGEEAVNLADKHKPQLMVADLRMPKRNGIDVARTIWNRHPQIRILFWSKYTDEIYVRKLGRIVPPDTVYGYILKGTSDEKFLATVRAVLVDEQCVIDREVLGVQNRSMSRLVGITDAEYEALVDLALGLTEATIARRRYLSIRGVQNRLKSLYTKLGTDLEQMRHEKCGSLYNIRNRAVALAFKRRLLNSEELMKEEEAWQNWLAENGCLISDRDVNGAE